jgi:hypothetical protein
LYLAGNSKKSILDNPKTLAATPEDIRPNSKSFTKELVLISVSKSFPLNLSVLAKDAGYSTVIFLFIVFTIYAKVTKSIMLSFYCRCIRCQPFDQLLQIAAKRVLSGIAQFVPPVDADDLIISGRFQDLSTYWHN